MDRRVLFYALLLLALLTFWGVNILPRMLQTEFGRDQLMGQAVGFSMFFLGFFVVRGMTKK